MPSASEINMNYLDYFNEDVKKKTPAAREERRHGAFLSSHTFEENCGGDNFTASLTYLHRCLRRCRANYITFFFFDRVVFLFFSPLIPTNEQLCVIYSRSCY